MSEVTEKCPHCASAMVAQPTCVNEHCQGGKTPAERGWHPACVTMFPWFMSLPVELQPSREEAILRLSIELFQQSASTAQKRIGIIREEPQQ